MASKRSRIDDLAPVYARQTAQSWVGKFMRDAYDRTLGLVVAATTDEHGEPVLLARFPGETQERRIWLEPREDYAYVSPGHVRARYRPPTDEDMAKIRALAARAGARAA